MTCREALERLGLGAAEEVLEPGWDEARSERPAGEVPFLVPGYVRWACEAAGLSPELALLVAEAARTVRADPCLTALAWTCHRNVGAPQESIRRWPVPEQAMGDLAGMFYVLVLLARTPGMQDVHQRRGIPPDVVRGTAGALEHTMTAGEYQRSHGRYGLSASNLDWLKHHWNGTIYRLGRLEYYIAGTCRLQVRVFRHRTHGQVVALAEDGTRFRADGQMDGAAGVYDGATSWVSVLEENPDELAGNPVDPTGSAQGRRVRLPKSDWREVLSRGSDVLGVHIPSGSRLDLDACGVSLGRARDVLPRCFPEKTFAAFTCHSWLLDTTIDGLLGPESNIVRFQREMYLVPRLYRRPDVVEDAIFGRPVADLACAPRETSLQRALIQHLQGGGRLNGGGACFLLLDDLDWGSQRYRRQAH